TGYDRHSWPGMLLRPPVSRIAQKVVARKQLRSFYWRRGPIPNVRIPRFGAGAHRYEAHPTSLARVDATMRGAARGDRLSVAVSRAAHGSLQHPGQCASPPWGWDARG